MWKETNGGDADSQDNVVSFVRFCGSTREKGMKTLIDSFYRDHNPAEISALLKPHHLEV
jgi:hypothetical protein